VKAAVPIMLRRLRPWGITNAYWFLGYHGEPVVWLATTTDAEKEALPPLSKLEEEVRASLSEVGVGQDLIKRAGVTYESEETVAREWDGNWWFAMK
jgi:hypothetical protein